MISGLLSLSLYRTTNSKIVEGVVELDSFPCLKVTRNNYVVLKVKGSNGVFVPPP